MVAGEDAGDEGGPEESGGGGCDAAARGPLRMSSWASAASCFELPGGLLRGARLYFPIQHLWLSPPLRKNAEPGLRAAPEAPFSLVLYLILESLRTDARHRRARPLPLRRRGASRLTTRVTYRITYSRAWSPRGTCTYRLARSDTSALSARTCSVKPAHTHTSSVSSPLLKSR